MLHLTIPSNKQNTNLHIDYQNGSIGFVVLKSDGEQIDFILEYEDWEKVTDFIYTSFKIEEKNKVKTAKATTQHSEPIDPARNFENGI